MQDSNRLDIELAPSRRFAAVLGTAHGLAMVAAWSSLSAWPLYLTLAGIAVSCAACLASALQRSADSVVSLELEAAGRAAWRDASGRWHEARLGATHFVANWLVIVCLVRPMRGRKWVVIPPEAVPAEHFRRLRVWLRWHRDPGRAQVESITPD